MSTNTASGFMVGENFYYGFEGNLERIEAYSTTKPLRMAFQYASPLFDLRRSLSPKSGDLMVNFDRDGDVAYLCYPIDEFFSESWYMLTDDNSPQGRKFRLNMYPDKREQNIRGFYFNKDKDVLAKFEHCENAQRY